MERSCPTRFGRQGCSQQLLSWRSRQPVPSMYAFAEFCVYLRIKQVLQLHLSMHTRFLSIVFLALLCILVFIQCKNNNIVKSIDNEHGEEPAQVAKDPLLKLLSPEQTGITFQNRIIESHENNITNNINIYNGGGLAVLDINNDQLPDIYFISADGSNALYLNKGNMQFEDITESAGVASGNGFETAATAVDINADGLLDLYVCVAGPEAVEKRRNKLFVNNGNLTFSEKAAEYGIDDMSASTGANFFDYDNDGDLDLYLLNYPTEKNYTNKVEAKLGDDDEYHPFLEPRDPYDSDRLYRNDGGKFTDVSQKAGIWNLKYGLSVSVSDFNYDGWPDVYIGSDFIQPDKLYINNKNGTFTDRLGEYFRHCSQNTMGADLSDFDNDGLIDLFALDMLPAKNRRQKLTQTTLSQSQYINVTNNGYFEPVVRNVLQHNNGNGTFSDIGCIAGLYKTDWSWSGLFFDMDNDGLRDVHVTNGYRREVINKDFFNFVVPELQKETSTGKKLFEVYPDINDFLKRIPSYKLCNFAFRNNDNWQFENKGGSWMTMNASWSCGSAWADFDADGDLDLVVNNLEDPAFVYQNLARQQNAQQYLQIKLQGKAPNPFAVGAAVLIEYQNGKIQYYENYPTRGIFSSVEHLVHFGLADAGTVDRVLVRWPDGKTQELKQVPANQRLTLKQTDATGAYTATIAPRPQANPMVEDITKSCGISYQHKENEFSDFEQFPLLPWSYSDLGPLMAVGDVNGDKLDDVFIGNSFDQSAGLYAQQPDGTFTLLSKAMWEQDRAYEDHGALFFDADADGDLDLLVLSGGAEAKPELAQLAWSNRLYINMDGKGNFGKAQGALPDFGGNLGLRAVAYDYDNDGDPDLFCGGRILPGKWPQTPRSVVLRNDRTHFTDVTAEAAPGFEYCGMVTDLVWANIDADPEPELVVTGEWMPITIFDRKNGKYENATAAFGLEKSNGLWYRLHVADLDADGDLDIVSGNLGLNTRLTASANGPLRCYIKDFDGNGVVDPLMSYFEEGKEYPLYQKEVLQREMPVLKKRLLYSKDYAEATIDKVWPKTDLDKAQLLNIYMLETCWWENQNGKFVQHSLPLQAQVSPVQGIVSTDVNGDGFIDLILAGNKYNFEVETNRCDSGNGSVLLGNGKGGFSWINNVQHGFWAMKEARDLALLQNPTGKPIVIVSNNNGPLQVYQLKKTNNLPVQ